jgi:hypothetical protein
VKPALALIALALTAGCAGTSQTTLPIGIGSGPNDLKRSPCNCGGIETEEAHKARQKAKREAAEAGRVHNDIIKDNH